MGPKGTRAIWFSTSVTRGTAGKPLLGGFWDGTQGAISNVAIWNTSTDGTSTLVPEADTYAMLLAGLGLVGFAARRKLNKTV